MKILKSNIEIVTDASTVVFKHVSDIEITSTWKQQTDIGTMVIPRKLSFEGRDIVAGVNPLIKVGSKISISVGYIQEGTTEAEMNTILVGYVSAIQPKLPITISLQDDMWFLKNNTLTKSYASVKLSELLHDVIGNSVPWTTNGVEVDLGQFRITRASTSMILSELEKTYGLVSWFRDGVLNVGLAYVPAQRKDLKFTFTKNIISDSLDYRDKDQVKINLTAISIFPDNTTIKYEAGDSNGETRTVYQYNLNAEQLKEYAEREIFKMRYTGFYGSFTAFGVPFVRHGDAVVLHDPVLPERDGTYLIKQVTYKFGTGGYRQEIELANKI